MAALRPAMAAGPTGGKLFIDQRPRGSEKNARPVRVMMIPRRVGVSRKRAAAAASLRQITTTAQSHVLFFPQITAGDGHTVRMRR